MDGSQEPQANIMDWDEHDVHLFLSKLGFPQYEAQLLEHGITGDILAQLDADFLREIGIQTIGQRLAILKGVYQVKLNQGLEIEPGHYVPASEQEEPEEYVSLQSLFAELKIHRERLSVLEFENNKLRERCDNLATDLGRGERPNEKEAHALRKQPSFKWAQYKGARSPTKLETNAMQSESPHPSPQKSEYDASSRHTATTSYQSAYTEPSRTSRSTAATSVTSMATPDTSTMNTVATRPQAVRQDSNLTTNISTSSENLKSFKVSMEDPAWKVLPAALKKYKINNDDWQNYAMFICYGQTERCLSYDEKPLLLFQKLKDLKKNPVFMLKHIRDIRSPIVVAQQKHAARKEAASSSSKPSGSHAHNRSLSAKPSKLNTSGTLPLNPPSSGQTPAAWPELMSPATEQKDKMDEMGADASQLRALTSGGDSNATVTGRSTHDNTEASLSSRHEIVTSGISYAVAIYPYMAEQDDEFDVVVGDTFIILSRARGWWVVQRDPAGNGIVDADQSKQGWVPAGCLLETNIPVAKAISEANAARQSENGSPPPSPASKTPILPLHILSTSFPGVALMDYRKKGDEELDLVKDDLLRVFKRYNHWSYAVKEDGGDRGWVPSWFIGKVQNFGQIPSTPSAPTHANGSGSAHVLETDFRYASETNGYGNGVGNQVSPMSSAFPAPGQTQQRSAVL